MIFKKIVYLKRLIKFSIKIINVNFLLHICNLIALINFIFFVLYISMILINLSFSVSFLDYVGFIKKIMKLMQHKYPSIKKLEIELRQLEEPITLPSRPCE